MTKKRTIQTKGGQARAKSMTPAERKAFAKMGAEARWAKSPLADEAAAYTNAPRPQPAALRDELACAVMTGLYSDIATTQAFIAGTLGKDMPLLEGVVRIAYAQADEAMRLRSL